jgi:hypothetical protein
MHPGQSLHDVRFMTQHIAETGKLHYAKPLKNWLSCRHCKYHVSYITLRGWRTGSCCKSLVGTWGFAHQNARYHLNVIALVLNM